MSVVATLIVALEGNIRGFTRTMDIAEARMSRLGSGQATAGLVSAAGLATLTLAGMATKMAIDFEEAFTDVRKTVSASSEQFHALEKQILDMSTTMPVAATEIARVAAVAGQLGIPVKDIAEFTRIMIGMGTATDMTAEEAATSIAKFMNIMQTPQAQVENVASAVVGLGNETIAFEGEILELATRIAGVGKAAQMSEGDILGWSAALIEVGLRPEMAGTAFQNLTQRMMLAVVQGGERLDQFATIANMSSAEFAEAWEKDASQAMLAFFAGLGQVENRGGDLIEVLKEMGFSEQRLLRMMYALSLGSTVAAKDIARGNIMYEQNAALAQEVEKRNASSWSRIVIFVNKAKLAMITFGATVVPKVLTAMDQIESWVIKNKGSLIQMWYDAGDALTYFWQGISPIRDGLGAMINWLTQNKLLIAALYAGFILLMVATGNFAVAGGAAAIVAAMFFGAVQSGAPAAVNAYNMLARAMNFILGLYEVALNASAFFINDWIRATNFILDIGAIIASPFVLFAKAGLWAVKEVGKMLGIFSESTQITFGTVGNAIVGAFQIAAGAIMKIIGFIRDRLADLMDIVAKIAGVVSIDVPNIPEIPKINLPEFAMASPVDERRKYFGGGEGEDIGGGPPMKKSLQDQLNDEFAQLGQNELLAGIQEQLDSIFGPLDENGNPIEGFGSDLSNFADGADKAAKGVDELAQAIERFNERRENEILEALVRDGPAGVEKMREMHRNLDGEWLTFLQLAADMGLEVPLAFRDTFDSIKTEMLEGAKELADVDMLSFLIQRRLGQGMSFGEAGIKSFDVRTPGGNTVHVETLNVGVRPDIPGGVDQQGVIDALTKVGFSSVGAA